MWPTSTVMQIACALRRPYSTMRSKVRELCKKGLLESKKAGRRGRPIKPDPQDFDEVKRDYCRRNHISFAELSERFERDDRLAAELYRRALEARLTRLRSRRVGGKTPGTGSSLVPASAANGAPTRLRRS